MKLLPKQNIYLMVLINEKTVERSLKQLETVNSIIDNGNN